MKKYIYTYYNEKMTENELSSSSNNDSDKYEYLDYVLIDNNEMFVYKLSRIENLPDFSSSDSDSNIFERNTTESVHDSIISDSNSMSESDSDSTSELLEVPLPREIENIHIHNANRNDIFKELIQNQITQLSPQWKLNINDMKRICKYIHSSIFDPNKCCIWNGYITNINNKNKGTYVNFYFKNKKVALHRLLYSNFVSQLGQDEYIKFNCENKGVCCNINHYKKYKYIKNNLQPTKKIQPNVKKNENINIICQHDPTKLIIDFD
jgi:hypothetical protein